jgi:tripartite-type tricarboxylate transporter receptor subunit TctC
VIGRRAFLGYGAGVLGGLALPRLATALDYPTRTVRLVVGFPPGGSADIVARIVAQALTERMGQTFVVDNKPGAGSNLGTETVARAEPDGTTLMADSVSNAINPTLYKKLNYDQLKDLIPVASIDVVPNVMDINVDVPAKTVPEFIAYAKANPDKISMGSGGIGSSPHVAGGCSR